MHVVEHAVDAVAHLELVFERLEVDVARLVFDRDQQQLLHELDDRVVVRGHLERGEVDRVASAFERGHGGAAGAEALERGPRVGAATLGVPLGDDAIDLVGGREADGDPAPVAHLLEVVGRAEVVHILDGDHDLARGKVDIERHELTHANETPVDGVDRVLGDLGRVEVEVGEALRVRERTIDRLLVAASEADEDLPEQLPLAAVELHRGGLLGLLAGDVAKLPKRSTHTGALQDGYELLLL